MKFFKNIKDALILGRKEDEALHAQVLHEIESGLRRNGLWSKALANADGSEERAKAGYIRLVVQDLRDQRYVEGRVNDLFKETNQGEIVDQISGDMMPPSQQQVEHKYQGQYGGQNVPDAIYRENKNRIKGRFQAPSAKSAA